MISSPANPAALFAEARRHHGRLGVILAELEARGATPKPPAPQQAALVRPDGRLTEAGIDALYAEFTAGTLTNRQIAEKFGISLSGVVKRRAMWRRGKR
jgi:hypothetical protein